MSQPEDGKERRYIGIVEIVFARVSEAGLERLSEDLIYSKRNVRVVENPEEMFKFSNSDVRNSYRSILA